jgi:hypothetical protein
MNQDDLQVSPQAMLQSMSDASHQGSTQIAGSAAEALRWAGDALNHAMANARAWVAAAQLDLVRAAEASRPLLDALKLWLQHTTPSTSQHLGAAAHAWMGHPAVQHVLLASAAAAVLALLLRAPGRTAAATDAGFTQNHAAGSWPHDADLVGAAAATGAASALVIDDTLDAFEVGEPRRIDRVADSSHIHDLGADMGCAINPATGLPMIGGDCSGIDVMGNPYGVDLDDSAFSNHDVFSDSNSFGSSFDSWSTSGSSWD